MTCKYFFNTCFQKIPVKLTKCKVSENKSSFILASTTEVDFEKIKFDDCKCILSKPSAQRCDWMIDSISNNTLYFVELKGSDIIKALNQLESSVEIVKPSKKFECHIVKSRGKGSVPSFNTKFQVMKARFSKINGKILPPHTSTHTVHI